MVGRERIEGFGNRFHPRRKPPSFASYVLFEKRSLFYREKKSVRPRSLFFSSPLLPLLPSIPPLFLSARLGRLFLVPIPSIPLSLSFVFFSLLSSSFSLARSLHSSLSFSLCPLGSAWMNEKRIRFCVLRETGFFPTLNYKTALQLFFPGARYFSFFRSL